MPEVHLSRGPATTQNRATIVVAFTSILFGLVPLFARQLQASGMTAPAIAFFRYGIVALVMLPFFPRAAPRREVLWVFVAGVFGGLGWAGYFAALEGMSVGAAGVIYMTYPLFALLLGWVILGERPTGRALGAGALILVGAALGARSGHLDGSSALLWLAAFAAPLSLALIVVVLSGLSPSLTGPQRVSVLTVGGTVSLLPWLAQRTLEGVVPTGGRGWWLLIGLAVVTALIPQCLYMSAAPFAGTARSAAAGTIELPTMLVVASIAFGEALGPRELLSAALVLIAVVAMPTTRPRSEMQPAGATRTPDREVTARAAA